MIIFGSILTTFELSSIFGGSWGRIENCLEPKTKPPSGNIACPNLCMLSSISGLKPILYNTFLDEKEGYYLKQT